MGWLRWLARAWRIFRIIWRIRAILKLIGGVAYLKWLKDFIDAMIRLDDLLRDMIVEAIDRCEATDETKGGF
jgi:hypothetical protein